jgi:hypothetical protein
MDNGINLLFGHEVVDQLLVADVSVDKTKVRVRLNGLEVREVSRVRQGIKHNKTVVWIPFYPVMNEIRANETGTAG